MAYVRWRQVIDSALTTQEMYFLAVNGVGYEKIRQISMKSARPELSNWYIFQAQGGALCCWHAALPYHPCFEYGICQQMLETGDFLSYFGALASTVDQLDILESAIQQFIEDYNNGE